MLPLVQVNGSTLCFLRPKLGLVNFTTAGDLVKDAVKSLKHKSKFCDEVKLTLLEERNKLPDTGCLLIFFSVPPTTNSSIYATQAL